jgi:outer membrane protein OmpA-like peptidoglycan-associated protein
MKQYWYGSVLACFLAACATPEKHVTPQAIGVPREPVAEVYPVDGAATRQEMELAEAQKWMLEMKINAHMAVDPHFIPFEKFNPRLDPVGQGQLMRLLPKLQASKSIVLRGHCYRGDVGNARAASQVRALETRRFLTDAGIPESRIAIRFDVERPVHGVQLVLY